MQIKHHRYQTPLKKRTPQTPQGEVIDDQVVRAGMSVT